MKRMFISWLIALLLTACSQTNTQEFETPVPIDEAEEVVEVMASTDDEASIDDETSNPEKQIIPPEDQIVQVVFTQEALDQIGQDLDDPNRGKKVLKIKPAID